MIARPDTPRLQDRAGRPVVILDGTRSAVLGGEVRFVPHRVAVATFLFGLDAPLQVTTEETGELRERIVFLPPGTECDVRARGRVGLVFCETLYAGYATVDLRRIRAREPAILAQLEAMIAAKTTPDLDALFHSLGVEPANPTRPEIARVVRAIGERPEDFPSVEDAARLAGLSAPRFQHVFSETVGIPFRRYRQWRRMGSVVRKLADGATLTEAAHHAGFANSAHLSTAFKDMFGLRPSDLVAADAVFRVSCSDNAEPLR